VTIDYKDLDNSDALRDLLTDTRFVELVSEKILQKLGSTKSKG